MTTVEICDALKEKVTNTNAAAPSLNLSNSTAKGAILFRLGDKIENLRQYADGNQTASVEAFNQTLFDVAALCVAYIAVSSNSVA